MRSRALRDPLSRRRLLRVSAAGVAAGSGLLVAGCGDDTKSPFAATAPDESDDADVEILNFALDLELEAVAAYKAAAGALAGAALSAAKLFLEQEQEHADALAAAIKDADGTPNRPKRSYEFARLPSRPAALRFATDLENRAIAAYIDALPKLGRGDLRATVASILANEAQHLAVLRDVLGEDPAPDAFVTGTLA